jgi:hypothetical protein
LARHLRRHPRIFLPPIKELRYFGGRRTTAEKVARYESLAAKLGLPGPSAPTLAERFGFGPRGQIFLDPTVLDLPAKRTGEPCGTKVRDRKVASHDLVNTDAWLRYWAFRRKETDSWYLGLFPGHDDICAGEISPAYCALGLTGIRQVHEMRDLSHAMFKIHRMHKMPFPQPLETYREFLNSRLCEKRSSYLRMIDDWMSVFGRDQVVLLYYDDILERPRELLQRLCGALSLDFDIAYFGDSLQRRVNATSRFQPPEELKVELARKHLAWLPDMERRFGGPAAAWREKASALVQAGG